MGNYLGYLVVDIMSVTETRKIQLVRTIENEKALREDLLVPLFRQMKYELVDYTHGAFERGKDIVLVGRDEMRDYTYTAVIVKCKDISNSTSGKEKESVANVCTQVAATITSGYACTLQNRDVSFNKIIVVTNGTISHSAKEEIVKFASKHSFTRLAFKGGEELVKWIDEFLPEFYASNGGSMSAYLGAIRKKCETLDELKNISIYKGEVRRLLDVFITPTLYRIHRTTNVDTEDPKPVYGKLDRIVYESGHVLILGGPGSGKSTLLRAEAQRLLNTNRRGTALALPVLVRAVDLIKYLGDTLEIALSAYVRSEYALPEFDLERQISDSSATLYVFVDGLEEVVSTESKAKLRESLYKFAKENRNHKIILSSRETTDVDMWSLPQVKRWNLMPMRTREIKMFISKWFNTGESGHPLLTALQEHDILSKLPKTPLVVTLLAILFDYDTQTEVPANLSELYNMFVDLLLGRWSLDRRLNTFYSANVREFVLCEVAEQMHNRGEVTLSLPAFEYIIAQCEAHLGTALAIEEVKNDLLHTTGLLVVNEKNDVEFRHLSFQEFLVAKRYWQRSSEGVERALRDRFVEDWWAPVVYHYCGLKRDNEGLLRELTSVARLYALVPGLKAAWNFGYLVQSSYNTSVDCRAECVKDYLQLYAQWVALILREHPDSHPFNELAPAVIVMSVVEVYKLYYASKFMKPVFVRVYESLDHSPTNFEGRLALVLTASVLAETISSDYLLEIYDGIKGEPVLDLVLNFLINFQLDSDNLTVQARKDMKKIAGRLQRKFREASGAYRALTLNPNNQDTGDIIDVVPAGTVRAVDDKQDS